ncbi:hypothetical protein FB45DRAFT_912962 [Roridomyces roridus]|uniref:Uncharacterized protein n=1 Tax=Roridomyces roridus TaxID=1738132 RepID=A0AAD7BWF8_9AGAR|nr:hypothetical protein FB45DRAFT_912962 [Roridomyces roridus]
MGKSKASKDFKPKRHHGYAALLFVLGTLFPPLAVAARFGIGSDFWLNLLLTICGYFPGHGHNFYIQNIRNNKNHARTPKWAQRYGLVDTSTIKRHERRSQWQARYNDRLPQSTLDGAPYEEGQDQGSSMDLPGDEHSPRTRTNGDLWNPEEEQYYNNNNGSSSSGGRWHYPANFDDAAAPSSKSSKKKKKEGKKDRWARTEDAYSISEEPSRKKSKKKRSKTSLYSETSTTDFPEAAEGGLYGSRPTGESREPAQQTATDEQIFNHEF